MEVYLIRHTTPAVASGFIYGRTDVPLADTFEQEKELIIKQLPQRIDAVFSSPSNRCTLLASAISKLFKVDENLFELNFGCWEGKTWGSINRQESEFWMEDFVNRCPPKGETMLQMNDRVMRFWNRLKEQEYKTVAVVSHGGVIRIIWAYNHGFTLKNAFSVQVGFGEIIKISL